MAPDRLPYEMGNAGDLVKHGVLAEFAAWWCGRHRASFRYLDPFGGRPWTAPPLPTVHRRLERLDALGNVALTKAQPEPRVRYYGSGHVIRNVAGAARCCAQIAVSDRDPAAREALVASGLEELRAEGFDPSDGYSVLRATREADLILIDPFSDFLTGGAASVLPEIADVAGSAAVVLFAMVPCDARGVRYARLRERHLPDAWSVRCPRLEGTGVRGEASYPVEVLIAGGCLKEAAADELWVCLNAFARCLGRVLEARIECSRS